MSRRLRSLLMVLLALIFTGSLSAFLWIQADQQRGKAVYSEAEELVGEPDFSALPPPTLAPRPTETPEGEPEPVYADPYAELLEAMDFSALQEINRDVLGWLLIPGTKISYPLLQGRDNDQYLRHNWKGGYARMGSIFLESQNNRDLSDFNTIVYGHNMRNKTMFGTLSSYKNLSHWKSHPCVYITDNSGSHIYNIFAAYEVSVTGLTYRLSFSGDRAKQEYIDFCLSQSVIDTGLVPTVNDQILTLSTCSGDATYATRWVVQAYLPGPTPAAPEASSAEPSEPPTEAQPIDPSPSETPEAPPAPVDLPQLPDASALEASSAASGSSEEPLPASTSAPLDSVPDA